MNILGAVPTEALFEELRLRKRIRALKVSAVFFNEHAEDDKYVRTMESELTSRIGAALHNELCITFEDQVLVRDAENRPTKTTREASLMVLVPEGVDDGEDR
jgi:uncharacterized NAD-dependent epimerase/dehydratase family protein